MRLSNINFIRSYIRNVGIMAHIDAGKTTTTERMLYYAGYMANLGEVHDGDTVMDYMEQERDRGITITSAAITFPWKKHQINLIDTPGHVDFTVEVERALRVLDGGIVILDASAGVQAQTLTVWRQARRNKIPKIIYINKLDKKNANLNESLNSIRDKLRVQPLLTQLPLYNDDKKIHGIADLIKMEKYIWDQSTNGKTFETTPIVEDCQLFDSASKSRCALIDEICNYDDALAEELINSDNHESISGPSIEKSLQNISLDNKAIVTTLGSSFKNIGVQNLLDAAINFLPHPSKYDCKDFIGMAFKIIHHPNKGCLSFIRVYGGSLKQGDTIYNVNRGIAEKITKLMVAFADDFKDVKEVTDGNIAVVSGLNESITGDTLVKSKSSDAIKFGEMGGIVVPSPVMYCSIEPPSMSQQNKLDLALKNLCREDPSLRVKLNEDTGETIVSGMGELHLEIILDRIKTEYKVEADMGQPMVAYKETISEDEPVELIYNFERNILGKDQKVVVGLRCSRDEESINPTFNYSKRNEEKLKLNSLKPWQLKAIKNGFNFSISSGPLINAPVLNVKFELFKVEIQPGTKDTMISSAVGNAVKEILMDAGPKLLEPVMKLEILSADSKITGRIRNELMNKRGQLISEDLNSEGLNCIEILVPLSELSGYSTKLRTWTSGQAFLGMELDHYAFVDETEQERIVNDY